MIAPKCTPEEVVFGMMNRSRVLPTIKPLNWQPAQYGKTQGQRAQQVKEEILKEIAALKARADYYNALAEQAHTQANNLAKMARIDL